MPSSALQLENEKLKAQLTDRDASIVDRDAKIERLAHDLATLEAYVKRMLSGRRGGHLIPEGQGLLFSNALGAGELEKARDEASETDEDEANDDESDGDQGKG